MVLFQPWGEETIKHTQADAKCLKLDAARLRLLQSDEHNGAFALSAVTVFETAHTLDNVQRRGVKDKHCHAMILDHADQARVRIVENVGVCITSNR